MLVLPIMMPPAALDSARYGAVDVGDLVFLEDGAAGEAEAGAGFEVFNRDGQAVQRSKLLTAHDCGLGGAGAVEGAVDVISEKGIDGGIDGLDPCEDSFSQLNWGELSGSDGGDKLGCGCAEKAREGPFQGSF